MESKGRVIYIEHDGTRHAVELAEGETLMVGAISNQVPGIDGDCGGCTACGTCHVHVHADWLAAVGPASAAEREMLQFADGAGDDSRLACQIRMRPELDGIVVLLPESQH
jgi:2Fe-2S ferredoxin